jgi:hypothetical protein
MYLIPLVRTTRAIAACTFIPSNPLLAITTSEIISYSIPFINNSPLYAINDMILFLFYYFSYNNLAIDLIEQFKNKYINEYRFEAISIITYLLFYFSSTKF